MNETRLIPIDLLDPSPTQPRKDFDEQAHEELTASMREHGFAFGALLVRPKPAGRFEIVIGERRTRAAKAAALKEIPCTIRDLSDTRTRELQLIENLIRSDLTPIEEAESYEAMLSLESESGKPLHTIDSIATAIGRDHFVIRRKLLLCNLNEEARRAVAAYGRLGRSKKAPPGVITLEESIAYEIGRIPDPKLRDQATARILHPEHAEKLGQRGAIDLIEREFMRSLRKAPFDQDDALLVLQRCNIDGDRIAGGACTDCPFRFEKERIKAGKPRILCLNVGCFDEKVQAAWQKWAAAEAGAGKNRRVASKEQAEKIYGLDFPDIPVWGCGLVDLDQHPSEELKPGEESPGEWRKLIGDQINEIEILIVKDRNDNSHELVNRAHAVAAAIAGGFDSAFKAEFHGDKKESRSRRQLGIAPPADLNPEPGKTIKETREQWLDGTASRDERNAAKKNEAKRRAGEEKRLCDLKTACIDKLPKRPAPSVSFWRLLALREFDRHGAHENLLKRYKLPVAPDIKENVAKWDAAKAFRFVIELIVTDGGFNFELDAEDKQWLKIFGVDYEAIAKKQVAKK